MLRRPTGSTRTDPRVPSTTLFRYAVDWLRTKGLAAAAKKAGRTAADGLVGVAVKGNRGAVVEVNAETDFVAKNDQFQQFVREVTEIALETGDSVEALLAATHPERSAEHTSELQSLMRISYAVFCLKKKQQTKTY